MTAYAQEGKENEKWALHRKRRSSGRAGEHEPAFGVAVLDLAGRLRRDAERVAGLQVDIIAVDCDRRLAVEEDVHFLVVSIGGIVFGARPAGIALDDGHAHLVRVQRIPEEMHRVRDWIHIPVIRFRVCHADVY